MKSAVESIATQLRAMAPEGQSISIYVSEYTTHLSVHGFPSVRHGEEFLRDVGLVGWSTNCNPPTQTCGAPWTSLGAWFPGNQIEITCFCDGGAA